MGALLVSRSQFQSANAMRVFQNGDEIFPPMLDAIASAKSSVHFATYVYEVGRVPTVFATAFSDAARRGVQVRIVLDRDGAKKIPPALIDQMRSAGCDVQWFRRAQWYDWEKYNRRSHRKVLVIDGRIGFTGGVGIADQWSGAGDSPKHWRDTHARVDGPAVAALQAVFTDSWAETTGKLVIGGEYFPPLLAAGDIPIATVQSNPANAASAAQRSVAAGVSAVHERSGERAPGDSRRSHAIVHYRARRRFGRALFSRPALTTGTWRRRSSRPEPSMARRFWPLTARCS